MNVLAGISGSLFPSRYLADALAGSVDAGASAAFVRTRRHLEKWWTRVASSCGPATGLREVFDVAAMPLAARLGFRARDAVFDKRAAKARLVTPAGASVALIVLPWAARPSTIWREAADAGRRAGAAWCLIVAPPYVSLVDARGHAMRQSLDFSLPEVLDPPSAIAFWTMTEASAFDVAPGSRPAQSRLDLLVAEAAQFQDRVREDLQAGVARGLGALSNRVEGLHARIDPGAGMDEALTLVYRILFLLFAESRDLVPRHHPIYRGAYSLGTLCREALSPGQAKGLWDGLAAITRLSRAGCRTDDLIVRPFNGRLFARSAAPSLESRGRTARATRTAAGRDAALREALIALATRPGPGGREDISYSDLGVEQLGSVYERVLDLDPAELARGMEIPTAAPRHSLKRKQTGTFYTPQSLAEFVVRRTLAPLVAGAASDSILSLRVVDPAMGSGAFLVAACRYLANAYEHAIIDEGRCSAADVDDEARADMRRLVAERCLAGVDANTVAVQLARLSLWLATLADGKPLGFLDHRLRTGNSLVGASPEDLQHVGDRRASLTLSLPLFDAGEIEMALGRLSRPLAELLDRRDQSVDDVRAKEAAWTRLMRDAGPASDAARVRLASTLWCARWFWRTIRSEGVGIDPPSAPELRAALHAILRGDRTLNSAQLTRWLTHAKKIGAAQQFFHWPIEFADIFYDPDGQPRHRPGFDAVIGNPPWEMLREEAGELGSKGGGEHRALNPLVSFIRRSGLYPSCSRGHVNLYQPFLERSLTLARTGGRVGLILPWGLATDDGSAALRARLFDRCATDTIVGLDNGLGMFPIHRGLRFMVVVTSPGGTPRDTRAKFGVRTAAELDALPDAQQVITSDQTAYPVRLSPRFIAAIGGAARRIPDVRRNSDLALLERLTREHPALGAADGWNAQFGRELNVTEDRGHFGAHGMPVIEGKHIHPFGVDVRLSVYRIDRRAASRLLPDEAFARARLAYRDVSGVGNRLALIAAVVPPDVVTTHTLFCLRTPMPLARHHYLCGLFNSFVLNAIARMLMGGHLTTTLIEGLPVPAWRGTRVERRIAGLARRLAQGGASTETAAALQALVARLYGLDRDAYAELLLGFPLVPERERDEALLAHSRASLAL